MLVELLEIAPGLYVAALFESVQGPVGPWWKYLRHAGGGSPQVALVRLGVSPSITVVAPVGGVIWDSNR